MEERLANELMDASEQHRRICKEKRRYAQDGRSKQGVCSLSFLILGGNNGWKRISIGENQEYRYYGAY